jgi:hypothetical protein
MYSLASHFRFSVVSECGSFVEDTAGLELGSITPFFIHATSPLTTNHLPPTMSLQSLPPKLLIKLPRYLHSMHDFMRLR